MVDRPTGAEEQPDTPWQLLMYARSLKKKRKFWALRAFLPALPDKRCLLVSCGDNNVALNWHFRALGGDWEWGDVNGENLEGMAAFLGDPVLRIPEDNAPFPDGIFDCIMAINVLERLEDDQPFLREMRRLLHTDGTFIATVPNGDRALLTNRIKSLVGISPELYGQTRAGYTVAELTLALRKAQLNPTKSGGYSRFFTEMMELLINFGDLRRLARLRREQAGGGITPTSAGKDRTHGTAFRLFSLLLPLMRLVSQLDNLLPVSSNNEVIVSAQKGDESIHEAYGHHM